MDCSTDILEVWKKLTLISVKGIKTVDGVLEEQMMKLDVSYNKLLHCAQNEIINYGPAKKMPKRQSKAKSGQGGDLFSTESGFQQPAVPPVRRTKRQTSILALDKMNDGIRESTTIASGGSDIRASRARALSSLVDITSIDGPKANSTFVVDKKLIKNNEDCSSPDILAIHSETYVKPNNANETYLLSKNASKMLDGNINLIPVESPNVKNNSVASAEKATIKKKSENSPLKNKRREKLEDIDVNISEQPQLMTRTMKRKLQEENQSDAKKTNVVHVLLEKQISTPKKPQEDPVKLYQTREQFAIKRKEIHIKSKVEQQKKIDAQHLKVANKKEELMKLAAEKFQKAAEEKKRKEEKQKERELMLKEEALKKQKQAELRLAEINAKRKQADDAKKLKMKAELKEEVKKKIALKQENSKPVRTKVVGTPFVSETVNVPKSKDESNKNDYGLNDVSARDSSDDESVPKKPVPEWAKRENRRAVLELQYHIDSIERDLFFDCPKSISLKEMFKGWNIRDKQRTSSAVWNTPPRYSEYIRRNC